MPVLLLAALACDSGKSTDRAPTAGPRYVATVQLDLPASADAARGYELFQRHCALCHGPRGDGRGPRQNLVGHPANFRNPAWSDRATPGLVFSAITRGSPGTSMPAFASLSEAEAWDLTAFVLTLPEAGP